MASTTDSAPASRATAASASTSLTTPVEVSRVRDEDGLRAAELAQPRGEVVRRRRLAPRVADDVGVEPVGGGHRDPALAEVAGGDHDDAVAGRAGVCDRRLHRGGAGRGHQDDVVARCGTPAGDARASRRVPRGTRPCGGRSSAPTSPRAPRAEPASGPGSAGSASRASSSGYPRRRLAPWRRCSRSPPRCSRCGSRVRSPAAGARGGGRSSSPGRLRCSPTPPPSAALAWGAAYGWDDPAFRVYYLAGGLLTAPLLGIGSLLLWGRRWAAPVGLALRGSGGGRGVGDADRSADVSGHSIPAAQDHLDFWPAARARDRRELARHARRRRRRAA